MSKASPESTRDVILGPFISGVPEQIFGHAKFHEFPQQHEPRIVRYTGRLLHIMRHDDNSVPLFEVEHQLFDLRGGDRVQR